MWVFFMGPCSKVWIWMWNVHIKPCKEWETTPTVMVTFQFKDDLRLTTSVSMTASQCHRLKFAQPPSPFSPPPPFDLINLLLKVPPPFYKNLHFYEANKWHCLHKDITRWSINTRVNTFQKRLLIGDVCMQIDMAQQDVSCSTVVKTV